MKSYPISQEAINNLAKVVVDAITPPTKASEQSRNVLFDMARNAARDIRVEVEETIPAPFVPPSTDARHKQFEEVFHWLSTRTAFGGPVPVWLWGAPGAGKTHLAEQLAEKLELDFYPVYLGPTSTESKILGFRNASLGEFVPGLAVDPYEKGGLLYLDEPDNADASVLVGTNALLSNNSYRFPNGVIIKRHKNFNVLAGANTLGTGSTQGFKRHAQDAALRSRFVKVQFHYDEELELALSGGDNLWTEYVQKVRRFCSTQLAKSTFWITSREIMYGAAALRRGIAPDKVCNATIFAEMPEDVRNMVTSACGKFPPPVQSTKPATVVTPKVYEEPPPPEPQNLYQKYSQPKYKVGKSKIQTSVDELHKLVD